MEIESNNGDRYKTTLSSNLVMKTKIKGKCWTGKSKRGYFT